MSPGTYGLQADGGREYSQRITGWKGTVGGHVYTYPSKALWGEGRKLEQTRTKWCGIVLLDSCAQLINSDFQIL